MGPHSSGTYDQFFLEPAMPWHRRYEALRAVFVEEEPLHDVAARFDVSYGTLRNWASDFRAAHDQGQPSPFFSRRRTRRSTAAKLTTRTAPRAAQPSTPPTKTNPIRQSPTSKHCRWKLVGE